MNQLRNWLLIVLCVLLPLRGAMAAAMLCPPSSDGAPSVQMLVLEQAPEAHGQQEHGAAHTHDHVTAEITSAGHDHSDTAAQDKCNMCAAFCSLTPAPAGHAIVFTPADVASAPSALISSDPPSFVPGGLERPPRSI